MSNLNSDMDPRKEKRMYLAFMAMLLLGLGSTVSDMLENYQFNPWTKVTGVVDKLSEETVLSLKDLPELHTIVAYHYTFNKENYTGEFTDNRTATLAIQEFQPGGEIEIYVNPTTPGESRTTPPTSLTTNFITIGLLVFAIIASGIKTLMLVKQTKTQADKQTAILPPHLADNNPTSSDSP